MNGLWGVPAVLSLGAMLAIASVAGTLLSVTVKAERATAPTTSAQPDSECVPCHAEVVERYRRTPMSRASGPAAAGFLPGEFTHQASGVRYRMERKDGKVYLRFDRDGPSSSMLPGGRALSGRRELSYFIGSGKRGRTYLFSDQGFWFESPVNWYAKKHVWDMAPNFLEAKEMPLTLPVDPGCLRCHATGVADALPEARNRFAGEPFREGGIRCASCHGDGRQHVASGGRSSLAVISGLTAVQRNSICLSCHLEGDEAVVRQGKKLVDFKPGESIFDYAEFFVKARGASKSERAASQWEALLGSGCRRGSGERLTCTSCHDPHGSTDGMGEVARVAYYRARCLSCHEGKANSTAEQSSLVAAGADGVGVTSAAQSFSQRHYPEVADCTRCHMPRVRSSDIAHEQVTDHSIPRSAGEPRRLSAAVAGEILPISDGTAAPGAGKARELGLAYAMEAIGGDKMAAIKAESLLGEAEARPEAGKDDELHARLGFLMQVEGAERAAAREYGLALEADPDDAFSAANLGIIEARSGRMSDAITLFQQSFSRVPWEEKTGLNLSILECTLGMREESESALDRVLEFSPDDATAQQMEAEIRANVKRCAKR